ncbi:MAG: Hsp70 family protein [Clostridiales bacterium]|jgi:molecular chaperone DnaK (HSP70)|nr:Hsp70 family protein [Clostridiales bacterium]
MAVYGIDLGTTYSVIATLGANNLPEVIENYADGSGTLASAVYFPYDGDPVVGKVAKNQAELEPERVIQYVKREIGKKDPHIYTFNGIDYDPIKTSSLILKRIKEYAGEQGHDVKDVVITCPAYFGNEERAATKQAGIIAGFNVLNIVNEPTAAALNYCSHEFNESRKILVFDLGGGTFDVTLIDFSVDENRKSTIEVIASNGDDRLGGIDWDAVLNEYMLEVYAAESAVQVEDIAREIKQKIRAEVEEVKKGLSFLLVKPVSIAAAGESARITLTRDEFENRTRAVVEKTITFVHMVLDNAKVKAEEVDVALLVGGSTMMPMIKAAVEAIFPGRTRVEQPDLAVAKGAALAAAIEWNESIREEIKKIEEEIEKPKPDTSKDKDNEKEIQRLFKNLIDVPEQVVAVNDKLQRSLGPAVFVDEKSYMIDNLLFMGDPIASEATSVYGTREAHMKAVNISVFENASVDKANSYVLPSIDEYGKEQATDPLLKVKKIGDVTLKLPPKTPLHAPIQVTFKSTTSGLVVTAINVTTLEKASTVIESENTMTAEELEKAKEEVAKLTTKSDI